MPISAGLLRHRVTLQVPTIELDESGAQSKTWADSTTVWASVNPSDGEERVIGEQYESRQQFSVTMRGGLTFGATSYLDYRFVHRSRNLYPIRQANPDERGELLKFICIEGD